MGVSALELKTQADKALNFTDVLLVIVCKAGRADRCNDSCHGIHGIGNPGQVLESGTELLAGSRADAFHAQRMKLAP